MPELRETLSAGIFKSRDNRFYASTARKRPGWVLQYLTADGNREHCKVYLNDLAACQQTADQIDAATNTHLVA